MKIYRIAWKFSKGGTYFCELCNSDLHVIDIVDNFNHHFTPGQLMECRCGKSRVWTNSIRYPEALIAWCDGEEVSHHQDPTIYGFCNDEYCPYCWGYWSCLKNGYQTESGYGDLYGCQKCEQNQHSIMKNESKLGEIEGQEYLANWYKNNQSMWRSKV